MAMTLGTRVFAVIVGCGLLTGCSVHGGQAPTAAPIDGQACQVVGALVEEALEDANRNGASDAQIADIEASLDQGKVTFEQHAAASERVRQCLTNWGNYTIDAYEEVERGVRWIRSYIYYPEGMDE